MAFLAQTVLSYRTQESMRDEENNAEPYIRPRAELLGRDGIMSAFTNLQSR